MQLLFNFALEGAGKPGGTKIKWDTPDFGLC
jgi:hypothetical protein